MRAFIQIGQQLSNVWAHLGLNQKVSVVSSVLLVLGGMVILVVWASRPQMQLLYGRLAETDQAGVISALESKGVNYEVKAGGSAIYVPSNRVHSLRMELAGQGIPSGDSVGYEIFDSKTFGVSDFVQRANYVRAVQGELGRTISQLNGVRAARVMVVMPENRLLVGPNTKPTASVFVDTGGRRLATESVNSIRFLVANSVESLQANDVAVIDNLGNTLSSELSEDSVSGAASASLRMRQNIERYLTEKVETMLAAVVGPGNAVVRVSAQIDMQGSTITEEIFDPDGQVVRTQTVTEDVTESVESRGQVAQAQDGNGDAVGSGPANSNLQNRINRTQSYEINRTTRSMVSNPGGLTGLSAAVLVVPRPVEDGSGAARPRTEEEIAAIRRLVVNALGVQGISREQVAEMVSVEEMDFFPNEIPETMRMIERRDSVFLWFEQARNLFGIGLAVAIFLVFLRLLKRSQTEYLPLETLSVEESNLPVPGGQAAGAKRQGWKRADAVSPELLNELIRQKPTNASQMLQRWLSTEEEEKT